MRRPGTRRSYERLLSDIRTRMPGAALRTTFIVGFPGETEADVDELEGFLDAVEFDHVGIFTYSHEEGTAAGAMDDDVPAAIKRKRRDRLMAQQRGIVEAAQQARVGQPRPARRGRSVARARARAARPAGRARRPRSTPSSTSPNATPATLSPGQFVEAEVVGARELRPAGPSVAVVADRVLPSVVRIRLERQV